MKLYTRLKLFLIIILFSNITHAQKYVIGFGSCLDQNAPQPIWGSIERDSIDSFIFLGDNVYGDKPSGDLSEMKSAYNKQEQMIPAWLSNVMVEAVWDDHDYGINDGGSTYQNKYESKELFLDFWKINPDDDRYKRDGTYFNKLLNINGVRVHLVALDTRFFRSDLIKLKGKYPLFGINETKDATILGDEQWTWLEKTLQVNADIVILISSIQVLPKDHGYEKWSLFPNEMERLINSIQNIKAKTIIISGDRHKAAIYNNKDIFEITSSSLNRPISTFNMMRANETDSLMIGKVFNKENYGLLIIDTESNTVEMSIKDIKGTTINSVNVNF